MFTFLVMLLDVSALLILAVFLVQCIRAVIMRALLVHKLKKYVEARIIKSKSIDVCFYPYFLSPPR